VSQQLPCAVRIRGGSVLHDGNGYDFVVLDGLGKVALVCRTTVSASYPLKFRIFHDSVTRVFLLSLLFKKSIGRLVKANNDDLVHTADLLAPLDQ
jgi:hypothetical protein